MTDPSHRNDAPPVRRLDRDRADDIVDVLCDAFADYPVMRHILGEPDGSYERRLRTLIGFFVAARVLRDEPMLGIPVDGRPGGVAVVSFPGRSEAPAELDARRQAVWAELGAEARARYEAFGRATSGFTVGAPHIHLNMIGVRPWLQGMGLGRRLLDAVHDLSRGGPHSKGVTLTTEAPANVPLYQHAGYELIGHARVAPGLETWGFFRADDP